MMVDRFQRFDDAGDGTIISEQVGIPFARMMRFMDRDGAISPDEMGPRAGMRQGCGMGGGGKVRGARQDHTAH